MVRRDGSQRLEELVAFGVGTNSEPDEDRAIDDGKRAVSEADACRTDGLGRVVDVLEAKARMLREASGMMCPPKRRAAAKLRRSTEKT